MELPSLQLLELLARVALAAGLGSLVGFEREISDQPAGFRTHILVSVGAALFTMVGAYGIADFQNTEVLRYDPTRIAAQIVTGIGFLGAGAILRQGVNVRGLTTAAALWVTAAIGTASGLGYYEGAVAVTLITVASLYGLKRVERFLFPRLRRGFYRFKIDVGPELRLSDLATALEGTGGRVESMKIVTDEEENRHLVARVYLPSGTDVDTIAAEIAVIRGVTDVEWRS